MSNKNVLMQSTRLNWQRRLPIELPLVQILFEQNRALTLSPLGGREYFTSLTMEHASKQPITEATFEKLAQALHTELTETLRHWIYTTVIGVTLMTVHKWYSPRVLLQLLKSLRSDGIATIANTRGDPFAEFIIATIEDEACQKKLPTKKVINEHIEAIREVARPGRPDEEPRAVFFESVVEIARRLGDQLALPTRDNDRDLRSTALFEFAAEMRDLVVAYGNTILDRRGLERGRFDGFVLERDQLIGHLEAARRTILRDKSDTYI